MDEQHYICKGGCKGVSPNPGVCQTQDCPHYQKPLAPCTCQDGNHGETDNPTPLMQAQ